MYRSQNFRQLSSPTFQSHGAVSSILPTNSMSPPGPVLQERKQAEDDDSRPAKKFQSKPKEGRKEYKWTEAEKQEIGRLMRNMLEENRIRGDQRFEELARRLEGFDRSPELPLPVDASRTARSIRNYWNRVGRAAHNLDEREKPDSERMVTGTYSEP